MVLLIKGFHTVSLFLLLTVFIPMFCLTSKGDIFWISANQTDQKTLSYKPLTLKQLEELVKNQTPDKAISIEIRQRGVESPLTFQQVDTLRSLGAGPKTIEALRQWLQKESEKSSSSRSNSLKLWITYAFGNASTQDNFDFLVQELRNAGIDVVFDRIALVPGQRLWEQIASRIEDPTLNGWAILVTKESIENESCKEELAYALDRTLNSKGRKFPLLGLVYQANVLELPAALRTRVLIDLKDPHWVQQVLAGLKQVSPQEATPTKSKYIWDLSNYKRDKKKLAIWVRPRFGDLRNWRFIFPSTAKNLGWAIGSPQNVLGGAFELAFKGKGKVNLNHQEWEVLIEGAGNTISPSTGCFIVFEDPFPPFIGFGTSPSWLDNPDIETVEIYPLPN